MILGAVVIIFYTMMGGFFAVAWTDLVQGIIMIGTLVVLPLEEVDDFLKTLGAEMMKKNKIGVFYREDGRIFVFTGKRTSAKLLLSGLKEEFRFRGGGGDTMVQGYIELEEERKPFVSKLYDRLLSLEL